LKIREERLKPVFFLYPGRTFWVRPVGSCVLDSGNVVTQGLVIAMDKPSVWAIGFFLGNVELSLALWKVISGISGFDD